MRQVFLFGLILIIFSACAPPSPVIRVPDEYRSWKKTVDDVLDYPIAGHGASFRIIYINDIGQKVVSTPKDGKNHFVYPDGTIIVKEVYQTRDELDSKTPAMLTVMVKDSQSVQAINGWLWIVKTPGDTAENVFTSKFCLECHLDANDAHTLGLGNKGEEFRDYVFFPYNPLSKQNNGKKEETY